MAFWDSKFKIFARRRPTMVGGTGGAYGAKSPFTDLLATWHPRPCIEPAEGRLVAKTSAVNMWNFLFWLSVLLPAPSPALPEAMAGATSMGGHLWLPRERPSSSTSSDDGASKSASGGCRGVEPAVAVTCGSTTPRRLCL